MAISPFEERYVTEMNAIFDDRNKLRKWLEVEVALAKTHAVLGNIPKDAAKKIESAAVRVSFERVKHIEDTALALVFRDAVAIIEKHLGQIANTLKTLAKKHKKTVCIGRTHGQHAVPTTYGMKFALYYQEALRNSQRLQECKKRILVGKMSGAVGTMATFGKNAFDIEDKVMKLLGLEPASVTNQVIQRDRHAELISNIAFVAAMLEKIAKEIRNLQRTEIAEIAESFSSKQVGSSTMPHKRNPHKSERVCSLARVVRTNVTVALENIALEHE